MKYRLRSPAGKPWYLHCVGSLYVGEYNGADGLCLSWDCRAPGHDVHGRIWTPTVGSMADELADFDFDELDASSETMLALMAGYAGEMEELSR
jgi:hypothetical protein